MNFIGLPHLQIGAVLIEYTISYACCTFRLYFSVNL